MWQQWNSSVLWKNIMKFDNLTISCYYSLRTNFPIVQTCFRLGRLNIMPVCFEYSLVKLHIILTRFVLTQSLKVCLPTSILILKVMAVPLQFACFTGLPSVGKRVSSWQKSRRRRKGEESRLQYLQLNWENFLRYYWK